MYQWVWITVNINFLFVYFAKEILTNKIIKIAKMHLLNKTFKPSLVNQIEIFKYNLKHIETILNTDKELI